MPKVVIPTPLRQYAGKQEAIELKAATVGELLQQLVLQHGDLRRHLYTDDGRLRSFVNIYVNDEDIRYLQKEHTAVKESDIVSIVPSIAGGVCVWVGRGLVPRHTRQGARPCPTQVAPLGRGTR